MLDSANLWRQIQFSGRYLVVLLRKCLVFRQFWAHSIAEPVALLAYTSCGCLAVDGPSRLWLAKV